MRKAVFFALDFQSAFGCAFFALFGHKTDRVWFMAQSDGFCISWRRGHFKVQRQGQMFHQPINVLIRDMAAVFAQVGSDAIGPGSLGDLSRRARGSG